MKMYSVAKNYCRQAKEYKYLIFCPHIWKQVVSHIGIYTDGTHGSIRGFVCLIKEKNANIKTLFSSQRITDFSWR